MDCKQCKLQITAWMAAYWKNSDEAVPLSVDAAGHISTCKSCQNFVTAARILSGSEQDKIAPPPFLTTRIKARLAEKITAQEKKAGGLPGWLRVLWQQQAVRIFSLGLAAALVLSFVSFIIIHQAGSGKNTYQVLVHFTLTAPEARQVAVVGDWNDWQTDIHHLTDEDNDGVWEAKLKIIAGKEYRYQFLIDGRNWVPDPNSLIHLEDGFGGTNSVLQL